MTLLDEIKARVPAEVRDTRDAQAIADVLNAGRVRREPREVGNGLILEALGMTEGNALLDVLSTAPDFRHVWPLVVSGRLDITTAEVAAALAGLEATGVVSAAGVEKLLALADVPCPLSEFEVRCAIWADDGRYIA